MLTFDRRAAPGTPATDWVELPWSERCKSRVAFKLPGVGDAGVVLPRGERLRDGDLLAEAGGRVLAVAGAPEWLLEARCADALALARAAYHLGNRHVPVQLVGEGALRFATDHVLAEMLRGLGVAVAPVTAPFEPEAGAYGGHLHHDSLLFDPGHGEHRGPRRIHAFGEPR